VNSEEKNITSSLHNRKKMKTGYIVAAAIIISLTLTTGCVSGPDRMAMNVTPAASLHPAAPAVPMAPYQLYIKSGQYEQFTYGGHMMTVNFTSAYPMQIIQVTVDGSEKVIRKEITESPTGMDWKDGNLRFTVKPVVWEIREGQNVPIYETSWNTSEVYFGVQVISPPSSKQGS
jgi:hypothetical protein